MNDPTYFRQSLCYGIFDLSGATPDEFAKERSYTIQIQDKNGSLIDTIKPDEILVFPCKACAKNFATKQSLTRHHERFPLCASWKEEDGKILSESVSQWAGNVLAEAIRGETYKTCKFCEIAFSSVGNFNKHFMSSVPCNRLAYAAVKKAFAEA
jgi:hypothetical protein